MVLMKQLVICLHCGQIAVHTHTYGIPSRSWPENHPGTGSVAHRIISWCRSCCSHLLSAGRGCSQASSLQNRNDLGSKESIFFRGCVAMVERRRGGVVREDIMLN